MYQKCKYSLLLYDGLFENEIWFLLSLINITNVGANVCSDRWLILMHCFVIWMNQLTYSSHLFPVHKQHWSVGLYILCGSIVLLVSPHGTLNCNTQKIWVLQQQKSSGHMYWLMSLWFIPGEPRQAAECAAEAGGVPGAGEGAEGESPEVLCLLPALHLPDEEQRGVWRL